jgi:hypothetical protein
MRFSALGVLLVSCGLTAFAAPAARPATVADLTVQMALSLGFEPATPAEARRMLLRSGLDLGSDLDTPLTRERAADLLGQLGVLAGPPADPRAPLTQSAVALIARTASEALMAIPPYPSPEVAIEAGCFGLTRDQCQSCCVEAAREITQWPRTLIRLCAHTCNTVSSPPSPSGP